MKLFYADWLKKWLNSLNRRILSCGSVNTPQAASAKELTTKSNGIYYLIQELCCVTRGVINEEKVNKSVLHNEVNSNTVNHYILTQNSGIFVYITGKS